MALIARHCEVIALCSIMRFSPAGEAEIGYGIAPSRQGRGDLPPATQRVFLAVVPAVHLADRILP